MELTALVSRSTFNDICNRPKVSTKSVDLEKGSHGFPDKTLVVLTAPSDEFDRVLKDTSATMSRPQGYMFTDMDMVTLDVADKVDESVVRESIALASLWRGS